MDTDRISTEWLGDLTLLKMVNQAPVAIAIVLGPDFIIHTANTLQLQLWQKDAEEILGRKLFDIFPELASQAYPALLANVLKTGQKYSVTNSATELIRMGKPEKVWFDLHYEPLKNDEGAVHGLMLVSAEVTDKVLSLKRLEEKEPYLSLCETLLKNSSDAVVISKAGDVLIHKQPIVFANQAFCTLSGYNASEVSGKSLFELTGLKPDELSETPFSGANTLPYKKEHTFNKKNGTALRVETEINVLRNEADSVTHSIVQLRPVSATKTEEAKVKQADHFRRAFIESSPDCVKVLDTFGNIQYINNTGLSIMEMDDFQLIKGKYWGDLWPQESRQCIASAITKALQGEVVHFDARCPTVKGSPRWWSLIVSADKDEDGIIRRIIATSRDITHRTLMEIRLSESQQTLQLAVEASQLGIWEWNVITNQISWDAQMFRIYGVTPTANNRVPYSVWSNAVHPDDLAEQEAVLKLTIENRTSSKRVFRIRKADTGALRYLEAVETIRLNAMGMTEIMVGTNIDITSRVQLDNKIKEQYEELETIYRMAPIGLAVLDSDLRFLRINNKLAEINGLEVEDHLGRTVREVLPDIADQVEEIFRAICQGGEPILNIEITGETKARPGIIRTLNENWFPIKNEDGKVVAVSIVAEDITNQRKAEQKLKESESRFRSIANDAPAFIFMANLNAEVECINDAWVKFSGLEAGEEIGVVWERISHPDDREHTANVYKKAVTEKSDFQYEMRQLGLDGKYHWILWKGIPRKINGEFVGILGFGFDITKRKEAEQILEQSEAHFRYLAEFLPQIVWTMEPDGTLSYASNKWKDYCGMEEPTAAWAYMLHPEDENSFTDNWKKHFSLQVSFRHDVRLRNQYGEYRWHHMVAEPVHTSDGKLLRWVGAMSDIHVQKHFAGLLEKEIDERTRELKLSNEELRRSNDHLRQFAHVCSHDLKEPVRKALTFISRVQEEFSEQIPAQARFYIERIKAASQRSSEMIDGVLRYSQMGTAIGKLDKVDLGSLLHSICLDLELPIKEKNASITWDRLPQVEGYHFLLQQLFYNLLVNCLKFSKANNDVKVHVSLQPASEAELQRHGLSGSHTMHRITVSDNGIGFDQQYHQKIFEPFVRLHSKDQFEGTGLGLALCKRTLERHSGAIEAAGALGEGASFHVFLPASFQAPWSVQEKQI